VDTLYASLVFCTCDAYTQACWREVKSAHRIAVGKSERKRQIWRTRNRFEDNIKTRFKEMRV
jgi:hypothetical protein